MQIALTQKLMTALDQKLPPIDESVDPLFTWTANWIKVWDNRKTEDMLVLVNHATRFTVAIYQVKRKDLKNFPHIVEAAIANTLLAMNLNPELVQAYTEMAGAFRFVRNNNRSAASWVSQAGLECAFHVDRHYNGIAKMFSDTIGATVNHHMLNFTQSTHEAFHPADRMVEALAQRTGKQPYRYRAFELLVTLDLEIYKAERRLIVPADLPLLDLHKVLQEAFDWRNSHLFDITVLDPKNHPIARLVPYEEDLEFDDTALLMGRRTLAETLPAAGRLLYTYDLGDNWQHDIELLRVLEKHDAPSPCLLRATGKTPPEDVGGVTGYLHFLAALADPHHPEHLEMKQWAGYWTPELRDWETTLHVIRI